MKSFLKLLAFLAVAFSATATNIVLPVTESFAPGQTTYASGASLNGQSNNYAAWFYAGNGGATPNIPMTITNANLSYAGLSQSISNAVRFGGQSATGDSTFAAKWNLYGANVTSGSLYYSLLLRVDDLGALSTSGSYSIGFNNASITAASTTVPTVLASLIYLKATGSGQYNIGTAKRIVTPVYDGVGYNPGDTVLIVSKYTYGAASQLWINPDPTTFGDNATEPTATLTSVDALTEIGAIQTLVLMHRTNSTMNLQPKSMVADEIRVGTTWAAVTPRFVSQPASRTNSAGSIATFSTTPILDTAGLTYQWKKDGVDISNGTQPSGAVASGATTDTLTLTGVVKGDEGSYSVAATNSVNHGVSLGATLTVIDPAITAQPTASQTVLPGVTVNLSVVAAGTPALTYRWQKGGLNLDDGGVVSGANTANLTLTGVSSGDSGTYTCAVTNGLGESVISSNAVVSVVDPSITSHPASLTNNYRTSATFTVAVAGTAPFTYRWLKDGVSLFNGGNISGASSSGLTVNPVSYLDAAGYSVIVSNGIGNSVTSSVALLTVNDPIMITQPLSQTNIAGTTATFTVVATGSPALTYQWKKGATALVNGGDIAGADAATLQLANVAAGTAGSYSVVVSNVGGSNVTSAAAVLTVATPPAIIFPPASRTVAAGAKVAFGVTATGFAPLSYQWKSNSVSIAGATGATYTIASAQLSDAGTYTVVITNMAGSASASASLAVINGSVRLYPTNLVVLRQGDGAATLTANGNSVYLDQYTTSGTYVNTVSIPDSGPSALVQNVTSTDATFDALTRSPDGWFLAVAGYATNLNFGSSLNAASSAVVPRAGGTINGLGEFTRDVTTTTKFSATVVRSFVTDGTNNFWGGAGNSGTPYFGFDSPANDVQTVLDNTRVMNIFNGDLYFVFANATPGLYHFGGLPKTAAAPTRIITRASTDDSIGNPPAGSLNGIQDFAVCPTCPVDGGVIYIADDRTIAAAAGGIEKWTYDDAQGVYVFSYRLNAGLARGLRSIAVNWSGVNPVIYAVTTAASSTNSLVKVTDSGASSPFTTLAVSSPNQLFRGVEFGPNSPSMNLAISSSSPTQVALDFYGVPGKSYVLQQSCVSLPNWQDMVTNAAPAGTGTIQFIVTPSNLCNPAFYRTREE